MEYVPSTQGMQELLEGPLAYVPLGQSRQAVAPAAENLPATHSWHVDDSALPYVPGWQS